MRRGRFFGRRGHCGRRWAERWAELEGLSPEERRTRIQEFRRRKRRAVFRFFAGLAMIWLVFHAAKAFFFFRNIKPFECVTFDPEVSTYTLTVPVGSTCAHSSKIGPIGIHPSLNADSVHIVRDDSLPQGIATYSFTLDDESLQKLKTQYAAVATEEDDGDDNKVVACAANLKKRGVKFGSFSLNDDLEVPKIAAATLSYNTVKAPAVKFVGQDQFPLKGWRLRILRKLYNRNHNDQDGDEDQD